MPWRLDHVQLAIPPGGEARSDAFYVDLLGFVVEEKPPALASRGGRWYRRDDAVVHLGVEETFVPAAKAHPALVVDDYADLVGRLAASGVAVRRDDTIAGTTRCHVSDPWGNRLELIDADSPALR